MEHAVHRIDTVVDRININLVIHLLFLEDPLLRSTDRELVQFYTSIFSKFI